VTGAANVNSFYLQMGFSFFLLMLVPHSLHAESNFTVEAASSKIDATVTADALKVSDSQLKQWVQKAADAVVAYYGRYAVPISRCKFARSKAEACAVARLFPATAASFESPSAPKPCKKTWLPTGC